MKVLSRNTTNLSQACHKTIPGKSIVPLLSASTSLIISCNSDSLGFCPNDLITVPNSFVVICPSQKVISVSVDVHVVLGFDDNLRRT